MELVSRVLSLGSPLCETVLGESVVCTSNLLSLGGAVSNHVEAEGLKGNGGGFGGSSRASNSRRTGIPFTSLGR